MRQALIIAGFNNWGKSTIISDLFADREKFSYSRSYPMHAVTFNHTFIVQSQSNDDLTSMTYLDQISRRVAGTRDSGQNLIAALCPSLDERNNFSEVLSSPPFTTYDRLYLFLIEYKWDHHARLMINNIREAGQRIPNINFVIIDADRDLTDDHQRYQAKMEQIRRELTAILGRP